MTKSSFYTGEALTVVDPPVPDVDSPGTGDSTAPSSFFHDSLAYDNIADPDEFAAAAAASAAAAAASAAATAALLPAVTSSDFIVGSASAALSAERVLTDTASVTWDLATAAQAKAKRAALTGDVTASADSNATTIAADAVTFAKMQNIATDSLIGRDTASTGDPENITLNGTLSMTGAGALQREALTGDVTASAGSNATTIANNAVTYAKMQDIATDSLVGRDTAGTGDPETISLNATLSMTGSSALQRAALTGDVTASAGSNATTIANDAVTFAKMQNIATDSLIGRDTASTGDPENITLNSTLSMTGAGALQREALTGDVTASAGSNATTIAADAVTNSKLANMAQNTIKGRITASTGDPEDLSAANVATILGTNVKSTESFVIAASDETTALTTGTGKVTFRMPYAFTVTAVRASLTTAQTSGSIFTVDINESGTSIISTKLTIDNTEKTSTTAVTAAVISDSSIADDAEMSIDIDQVGDGTAKGLKVVIIGNRT